METWKATEGAKYGIAIYNFEGKVTHGLPLDIGDAVQIYESCAGWYRGCCLKNKALKGIFPASFIQLKECIVENLGTPLEVIIPSGDPVVKEVTAVLREWLELWKKLFQENQHSKFSEMEKLMNHLVDIRFKILSGVLTQDLIVELKGEITSKIDYWNSQMDLDLVPRVDGEAVDVDQMSVVELYKIHNVHLERGKKHDGEEPLPRTSLTLIKANRHILLEVKSFFCNIDDFLEVFISLFSSKSGEYLSERFMMCLNNDATSVVAATLRATKTKTLFTDLGKKSLDSDLFIVCHIVRTGQMHINEQSSKKKNNVNFRRPFACGVLNVQENVVDDDVFGDDRKFVIPIYPCNSDTEFHSFHDALIRKGSNKPSTSNDSMNMEISFKVFNGDRMKVIKSHPLWIPPDIPITRKLGFPEVVLPGDLRNDLYITLDRGEFEKGAKTAGKNVQVCVSVLASNGTVLQNCICAGTGSFGVNEYQSLVFYHNNFPKWDETIKFNIPPDKFQDCHVLFLFKHCPTSSTLSNAVREKSAKVFAFAFLNPLRPDGTTIVDGSHQLIMYKTNLLDPKNPGKYLSYPSFVADLSWVENQQHVSQSMRNTKELFFIKTLTCSTKLTQNLDLVGLLKWRQQKNKIPYVLTSLMKVPGYEIMKFLQDILDALFSILNDDTEKSGMLVFNNLIFLVNLLLSNKYQQFQPVLNTYIKRHFSAALAYRHLLDLFNKFIVENSDAMGTLKLAKALEFILKFIMQSWTLYIRTHPEQSNFEFKQSVRGLFTRLEEIMQKTEKGWRGAQSVIMSRLPTVYVELSTVFKDEELAEMLQNVFVTACSNDLVSDKLIFMDGIITTSPLYHNASSRATLMPLLLSCLHQQLLKKNELQTCAELLGNFLTCLSKVTNGSVYEEVDQIAKALLQVVFQAVVAVDRTSPRAGRYVAILFTLLKMMTEEHYQSYLQSFSNLKDLRDFLTKAFGVFINLLQRNIYPDDWFVMKIEGDYVILGAVQNISQALIDNFLLKDAFDYQLWNIYFQLAISFVSHELLNLDKYSEAKRMKILERYGDMRHVMGFEIVKMWNALGELQSNFIPSMIAPFLKMTLVPEPVLRQETLPIFYDMMEIEMKNTGNIDRVEEEFVNKLDVFLSKDCMGDENYKELFRKILTEKIKQNPHLMGYGLSFVNSVTQLLERLLDYRKVISSREEYRDMKMTCIVNLMNYYDEKGKEEMYLRYVAKLYSLHLAAENYCEAGFALYLYASRLKFEDWPLKAEEDFPAQTEGERKESLYRKAIEHFDKGKLWESGIRLCKKLINLYENETFDFIKLSGMLETEAEFYKNIVNEYRPEPVYFRVGFYGKAFPSFLQNKQFIYRGKQLEKIGEFCSRIQNEYPDAEVLRHNNPLEEEILLSNKQYIQCCEVKPVADNKTVPDYANNRISRYYDVNWINKFRFSRPFHKGQKEKNNEFATLWSEVITLATECVLPGILPWIPVLATESAERSPIENAINTVRSKTSELERIVQELKEGESGSVNPLSMILNGIVDPAVNGGIANYRKAFFTPEYTRTNPQRKSEVDRLQFALHEQAAALRRALIFHESRISGDVRPLHENLVNQYNNMVGDLPGDTRGYILILRKLSLPMSPAPGSPLPPDRRTSTDPSSSTLGKVKSLFMSFFDQDDENNRQSVSSEGMKQSTSLMSFSDHNLDGSKSVSVPDLRDTDSSRPKLPQKQRKKVFSGNISSPAPSRTSVDSSVSINSLTEIDEMEELRDGSFTQHASPPTHKRVPTQADDRPPAVPPKRFSISSIFFPSDYQGSTFAKKRKNRQSHNFDLSSSEMFTTSKKLSKSLDDLDKVENELRMENESSVSKCARNEDHLNTVTDGNNQETIKDGSSKDNLNNVDEEKPPPLMPRTYKPKKYVDDAYDTVALPPSQSRPVVRGNLANNRGSGYDTVSGSKFGPVRGRGTLEPNMRMKHYYANLAKSRTSPLIPMTHNDSNDEIEEPYDTLTLPDNKQPNRKTRQNYQLPLLPSRKDVYDFVTHVKPASSNKSTYETVVLPMVGGDENGLPLSQLNDNKFGQDLDDVDRLPQESVPPGGLDRNANPSEVSPAEPPLVLPPKNIRKDVSEACPPVAKRTSSSVSASSAPSSVDQQESSPSNSPSSGRKKPPRPLPKPRHNVTKQ